MIGLSGEQFWDMSPCELQREFDADDLRRQHDADRDVALAWHTAVFALQGMNGKLQDLRVLLQRRRNGRQTPEEQRQVLAMLSEQYGIPLTVH